MRLFFALWPDAQVRDALAGVAAACREHTRGRVIPAPNLHATLAFLGEVDATRLPALARIVERLAPAPFDLVLDRLGYFRRSRIVYAAPAVVPPVLLRFAAELASALAADGFRIDDRPYTAHVTLLRDARAAPSMSTISIPPMWHVRHIVLAESVRGRVGPVYEPLRRFMLGE